MYYDIGKFGTPHADEIVKDQLYIGNITGAHSLSLRNKLGITHILSVVDQGPLTGVSHLVIPIDDLPDTDILAHLNQTCQFIEDALQQGGKILVHCAVGISRSPTVVAAYLMKSRKMHYIAAIWAIEEKRPQVNPNNGFVEQLEVFGRCNYDPSPSNAVYSKWRRRQRVKLGLGRDACGGGGSTTTILSDQLYASINSQVPEDPELAEELLVDLGITHILSFYPWLTDTPDRHHHHHHRINITENQHDILIALPGACKFIHEAIEHDGVVLVHSPVEARAVIVLRAFLMMSRNMSLGDAYLFVENALQLSEMSPMFLRFLEVFEGCKYEPTLEHPVVKELMALNLDDLEEKGSVFAGYVC